MTTSTNFDLKKLMQERRAQRLAECNATRLLKGLPGQPWAESNRGYLVVQCPECKNAAAIRLDSTDAGDEIEIDCDVCGVCIAVDLEWETVRNLVNVTYKRALFEERHIFKIVDSETCWYSAEGRERAIGLWRLNHMFEEDYEPIDVVQLSDDELLKLADIDDPSDSREMSCREWAALREGLIGATVS